MTDTSPIALFGAGGKTGSQVLRLARERDIPIKAFEHDLPAPEDRFEGVEYIECDVLNDDFAKDLEGCRAVVSALGVSFGPSAALDPPPLYTDGTRNLIAAMKQASLSRLVLISAAFVEHQPSVPTWFDFTARPALHNILEQMRTMEGILVREPEIAWTAARPGWLLDEPFTGEAVIADRRLADGCFRCRHADLAGALLDFVIEDSWVQGKPAIGRPEAAEFESITAIKAELGLE